MLHKGTTFLMEKMIFKDDMFFVKS